MIAVRPYRPSDREVMARLLIELEIFHKSAIIPSFAKVCRSLSNLPAGVEFLVAEREGQLIGLASIATLYPATNADAQLYLKELFVTERHRTQGAGGALITAIAALALDRGYDRIDWTTETDNLAAQQVYEKFGATKKASKIIYRLEGDALKKAAER